MKKKKPKKSSPSKSAKSSKASPPLKAPASSHPPKPAAPDHATPVNEVVSDAQLSDHAVLDAQLPRDGSDLGADSVDSPPPKTVIAEETADPSSLKEITQNNQNELSLAVPAACSSDTLPVATEVIVTPQLAGSSTQLAKADAKTKSQSSLQAGATRLIYPANLARKGAGSN
ncbi:hypothetical protein Rs2_30208 [Raphanus sativus]|nr:hypothetical protein Rs2_30208 [Raphanus sativus]